MEEIKNEIKVIITIAFEDYQYFGKKALKSKRQKLILFYIIAVFCIMVGLSLMRLLPSPNTHVSEYISAETSNDISGYITLVLTFIVILAVIIFMFFLKKSNVKKYFFSEKKLQQPIEYIFTNDYFTTTADWGSVKYKWDEINRVVETKNGIVIFPSTMTIKMIPKRFFADESSYYALISLLKSKFYPKKYKNVD